MNTQKVITELKRSSLYAECPSCESEFQLSSALLFDGIKPFPPAAITVQQEFMEDLKDKSDDLRDRAKRLRNRPQHTRAVNVGKQLEKVLPTMRDFRWELPDCRFLGDPIDMITFNGLSRGRISSISFIEVKTGNATLNKRQKSIIEAVEDKKVFFRVMK